LILRGHQGTPAITPDTDSPQLQTSQGPRSSRQSRQFWQFWQLSVFILFAGCAARPPALPGGPGAPFADYAAAYAEATARCRGVRTFAGVLDLSGRASGTRIRARINAGFASPDRIRLEGLPPALAFGKPIFVLVGQPDGAMLVLPRDRRVLTGEPTERIIEALAGVALTAEELRAAVSGCGFGIVEPQGARAYENGWIAVDAGETTMWLRHAGGSWQPAAAVRGSVEIRYEEFSSAYPGRIRIRTAPAGSGEPSDLTLRVSDVDINTELGPEVFRETIPEGATPLTLEELRRSRPGSSNDAGQDANPRTAGNRLPPAASFRRLDR
jgi:hypothetical protein